MSAQDAGGDDMWTRLALLARRAREGENDAAGGAALCSGRRWRASADGGDAAPAQDGKCCGSHAGLALALDVRIA